MRKTLSFVARFWQEREEGNQLKWRGMIIHVATGERIPVRSVEEAMQLILSFLESAEKNSLESG